MKQNIAQYIMNGILAVAGLSVIAGILIHDTAIDRATATAFALPAMLIGAEGTKKLSNAPHTHSERSSLYQAVRDLKAGTGTARIQPRNVDDRRYVLTHPSTRGHFAFGNDSLPYINE